MTSLSFEYFMLTHVKEWLFLTFFPQENINDLNQLRRNLTSFLKAIMKALTVELEVGYYDEENTINDIIQNIPAEISVPTTTNFSAETYDTVPGPNSGIKKLAFFEVK